MLICIYRELLGIAAILQLRGQQRDASARHDVPARVRLNETRSAYETRGNMRFLWKDSFNETRLTTLI